MRDRDVRQAAGRRMASSLRQRRAMATAHARRFLVTVARTMQENGNGAPSAKGAGKEAAKEAAKEAVASGASKKAASAGAANGAAAKAAKSAPARAWWKQLDSAAKDLSSKVGSGIMKKVSSRPRPHAPGGTGLVSSISPGRVALKLSPCLVP